MDIIRVLSFVNVFGSGCSLAEICPPDWHRYGESCYFIIKDKMNWYEANRTCAELRANLVVPNSQSEHDYIWELFLKEFDQTTDTSLWIGCNDIEEEEKWQHCPGKGETNAYGNWADGEPNNSIEQGADNSNSNGGEDCGGQYVHRNGKWNDFVCHNQNFAICELSVSDVRVFCLQTGNDGRPTSQCMLHHVLEELPGKSVVSCGKACRSHPRCRSFNLLDQDGRKMVCQLNNATSYDAVEGDMVDKQKCTFFEL